MSTILIESIGIVAGILGIMAWIPQLREVWVEGLHEGISLPTFWLVSTALVLWLIYGHRPRLLFFMSILTMICDKVIVLF